MKRTEGEGNGRDGTADQLRESPVDYVAPNQQENCESVVGGLGPFGAEGCGGRARVEITSWEDAAVCGCHGMYEQDREVGSCESSFEIYLDMVGICEKLRCILGGLLRVSSGEVVIVLGAR